MINEHIYRAAMRIGLLTRDPGLGEPKPKKPKPQPQPKKSKPKAKPKKSKPETLPEKFPEQGFEILDNGYDLEVPPQENYGRMAQMMEAIKARVKGRECIGCGTTEAICYRQYANAKGCIQTARPHRGPICKNCLAELTFLRRQMESTNPKVNWIRRTKIGKPCSLCGCQPHHFALDTVPDLPDAAYRWPWERLERWFQEHQLFCKNCRTERPIAH